VSEQLDAWTVERGQYTGGDRLDIFRGERAIVLYHPGSDPRAMLDGFVAHYRALVAEVRRLTARGAELETACAYMVMCADGGCKSLDADSPAIDKLRAALAHKETTP